ncbi:ABC transporter permease subunit [Streptomyces sp. UG1]|uniref:ABC transporter permease subunit n=1 Tax=Streptomyces sp. UG1 TaxID=3417652 RepID=UPI003CF375BB
MGVLIQFVVLGLCTGALYALAALGVVIVHRGSGVINFAHSAVGALGAYTFYELHDAGHHSFLIAFVPSLVVCALAGLIIQFGVMRPLRDSSPLTHLLATLGVLALVQGLLSLHYREATLAVASSLPRGRVSMGGIHVGEDRLLILGIVLVAAVMLALLYGGTRFGRATAAVAENQLGASYLGLSPGLIAGANWAIGSMLAGTAAILLAPITGLQIGQLTLLIVPALAAAVVGNMNSFPLTVLAGLVIGVAETLAARYANGADWGSAAPFLLVLIVLSLRGRALPDRSHLRMILPSVGSGRIRPVALVIATVLGIVLLNALPLAWVDGATTTVTMAVVVLSITVVTGYGGQISLAQVVLGGFGAWVAGRLVASAHFGFLPALVVGVLATLPLGIVVGMPALRARGANLGIITLAFGVAMEALLFNSGSLTGGDVGTQVGVPTLFGIHLDTMLHPRNYAIFSLIMFILAGLAVANLRRGKAGRRLLAVRANERAAAASGVNTTAAKLYAFSVGAMLAGLGGILVAFRNSAIVYSNIHAFDSVNVLGYGVIGGVGYIVGPLVGGVLQPGGIGTNIGNLFSQSVQDYLPAIGGALLIITLITAQNGVASLEARRWGPALDAGARAFRKLIRRAVVAEPAVPAAVSAGAVTKVTPRELRAEGLSVVFGATKALDNLTLDVRPGEVVGLIGPNGAGKTTAIDAVTGFVKTSSGRLHLGGKDLTGSSPRRRAEAGLGRSFQSLELFEDMTVLENLLVVSESRSWWSYVTNLFWAGKPQLNAAARAAVELLDLGEDLHRLPTELSYGRRRLVAIARAIAGEPSVLLLDEPAAGLSQHQSAELKHLLRHLAEERGMGVLLVEHDVDLVMSSCDRVVALVFGAEVAAGTPAEVRNDRRVVEAYLGEVEPDDDTRPTDREEALEAAAPSARRAGETASAGTEEA